MLDLLTHAALEAGKVQRNYFRKASLQTQQKTSHQNLVTDADFESEQVIYDYIFRHASEASLQTSEIGFISEEKIRTTGKHLFIIDPLDGTNNFASGFSLFCTILAYYKNNKPHTGVIYFPIDDTLCWAQVGKGAYFSKSGTKDRLVVQAINLKDCLVPSSITSNSKLKDKQLKRLQRLHPHIRGLRNTGCAGFDYMSLARNSFGVVAETHNYIWDIAAAKIILEEAGGNMYDWKASQLQLYPDKPDKSYQVLACHPTLLRSLMKVF